MISKRVLLLLALLGAVLGLIWKCQPLVRRFTVLDPALSKALRRADLGSIRSLVSQGANVNHRIPSREPFAAAASPLMVACYQGDVNATEELIAAGADLNLANDQGQTALMLAAEQANPELVRILIRAGARPRATDHWGATALMRCACSISSDDGNRRLEVARQLIRAGASQAELDEAVQRAETLPNPRLAQALRTAGGKALAEELHNQPGGKQFLAVRTSDMAALKRLAAAGASFNVRDREGRTPLIDAARLGDPAILRFLLAHASGRTGSLLNQQDNQGDTALLVASQWGNQDSSLALIAAGVDLDLANDEGKSALHYAAYGGQDDVVRALLARHANVTLRDRQGKSPLACALESGHVSTARLLSHAGAPK